MENCGVSWIVTQSNTFWICFWSQLNGKDVLDEGKIKRRREREIVWLQTRSGEGNSRLYNPREL